MFVLEGETMNCAMTQDDTHISGLCPCVDLDPVDQQTLI